MVEIIGIDPKYIYRVTHDKCGNILEYQENEVIHSSYTDYGGDTEEYDFIVCPRCQPGGNISGLNSLNYETYRHQIKSYAKVEVTKRKR